MVKLQDALHRMAPFRVLVLGDFLVDRYTLGVVQRISPEAPVPILQVFQETFQPGGAGNVVLNLLSLGAEVWILGRIGEQEEGFLLKQQLQAKGVHVEGLRSDPGYQTPIKNRLVAEGQQLFRVDFEASQPISSKVECEVLTRLTEWIPQVNVVAISDYGKGFLSDRILQQALLVAKASQIPSLVDPKGIDFIKYQGAYLLKPNLMEAYTAAQMGRERSLDDVAQKIHSLAQVEHLLITRSQQGSSLFGAQGGRQDFPVRFKEVKDVTGAGDTVLAMLCAGFANHLDVYDCAHLANIAAGLSIEKIGCAQIGLSEVAARLKEYEQEPEAFQRM